VNGSGAGLLGALLAALLAGASAALALPPARRAPVAPAPVRTPQPNGSRTTLRTVTALAVGLGVALLLGGLPGAVAGPPAGFAAWWAVGRLEPVAVRRRRERLVAAVPHVVDLVAACLAAGLSPSAALEEVAAAVDAPARDELAAVSARLRVGVDPGTVWRDLSRHPQLGGLGRAVARAVETGASVADALERLAGDLRRTARAEVETRARAVGVKAAVPLGLCLLPAFVLVGVVPLVAGSLTALLGS